MDTNELFKTIKNLVQIGTVSEVDPLTNTARVYFKDQNNKVSSSLAIINRGSKVVKDYWMPDIGEQVICLILPSDKNKTMGWILGSDFTEKCLPQVADANVRRIDFGDGSYIEYDRGSHTMNINCIGPININGATIHLNE